MTIDAMNQKGVPPTVDIQSGWNIFDERAVFPVAILLQSKLRHNSLEMAEYCRAAGVSLAPHGKTTMSPQLFQMQVSDGAWGITAANVYQARIMEESGVPRILIANEVTMPSDIAWLAEQVAVKFDVTCYVDSILGVQLLEEGLQKNEPAGQLKVLVELGVIGGRTGARTLNEAVEIARAVAKTSSLQLAGVSGFEGIIGSTSEATAEERVDYFLDLLSELAALIAENGLVPDLQEFIISAGGSIFFDRVVKRLSKVNLPLPTRVVIRSGCYLSHDDGVINDLSPLGAIQRIAGSPFEAALEVWAPVLSRPEPERLILGAGKRDVSTDSYLPQAKKWVSHGSQSISEFPGQPRATKVDDQHVYLDIGTECDVNVGDVVGLGISHPCTTFDKWKYLLMVDDKYNVTSVITTRF